MMCENCGKNPASYHSRTNINGAITEKHLCAECAAKEEHGYFDTDIFGDSFFAPIFPSLFAKPKYTLSTASKACPVCGMTEARLANEGRVGCAHCYEQFGAMLEPYIFKIHGKTEHTGMHCGASKAESRKKHKLAQLKEKLSKAVEEQEFERAAQLRDEIKELQDNAD